MKLSKLNLKNCFLTQEQKRNYNKELFKLIAPKYNTATKVLSFYSDEKWKNKFIEVLPKSRNINCLDLACGTGDVTFKLAQKYSDSKIYGLDVTQKMLEEAKKINEFKNIEFICADMCNTNFENNTFDIITGSYALRNSSDLNQTLMEINRILKSNGVLATLDFAKFDNKIAQKTQYLLLYFWGCLWGIILHGNYTVYSYIAESLNHYPSNQELNKLMKDFNLQNIYKEKFFFGIVEMNLFRKT